MLGDQAGLTHAKADAAGVMKDAPYHVRWANFPGAAPLFEAMNAGAVDTAPAGDAPLILAAAGHVPLKIVAITHSSGRSVGILVPQDSPIHTVADLKGHHVIVSSARGSVAQYLLLEALRQAHVAPADLTIGFMLPNEAASAFEAGKIDGWATFGSYQAIAEARGARELRDGAGINSGIGVIAASQSALEDPAKRAAIADYLQRQAKAGVWSQTHPDAAAAIYARQTGVPLAVARTIIAWENPVIQPVDTESLKTLQQVADRFKTFAVGRRGFHIVGIGDDLAHLAIFPSRVGYLLDRSGDVRRVPAARAPGREVLDDMDERIVGGGVAGPSPGDPGIGASEPDLRHPGKDLELSDCAPACDRRLATSAKAGALRDRQLLVRLLALVAAERADGLADRLIGRFGSFQAILRADPIARARFLSAEPAAADQLDIVQEALLQASRAEATVNPLFPNTLVAADYLMLRLANKQAEQLRVLYLDNRHMLIRDECMSRGSVTHAPIYPREIIRRGLELGASSLILAHNHPSGDLTPSPADVAATRRVQAAGEVVEIQVLDHLIVSRSGCRSLRAEGMI